MKKGYSVSVVPKVYRPRTRFSHIIPHITTCNVGDICPFFVQEIYPGDTFILDSKCLNRNTSSYVKSPMVHLYQDIMFFFVPHRLTWEHFEEFNGANKSGKWANTKEYKVPMITYSVDKDDKESMKAFFKSVLNRLGAKPSKNGKISALLPRAFALIYDEWFRNENLIDPMNVNISDVPETANIAELSASWGSENYVGQMPKASRNKDYFSCCLPAPQKGDAPEIKFSLSGDLPVRTKLDLAVSGSDLASMPALRWQSSNTGGSNILKFPAARPVSNGTAWNTAVVEVGPNSMPSGWSTNEVTKLFPNNVWAIGDGVPLDGSITVNDLRLLVQTQMLLELQARGGTRYQEILANEWGVVGSDSRLQIPEFLGGKSTPLNVIQVPQTSASQTDSKQANISAFGQSLVNGKMIKSFNEHGYVIGVSVIRMKHLYQQGNERFLTKEKKTDWYNAIFAGIGEQPVYKREIYADLSSEDYDSVFGYMPYAEDLRTRPGQISGQASDLAVDNLGVWQAGDLYFNEPVLGKEFIEEDERFLDKCLQVPSTSQDQFLCEFSTLVTSIREVTISGEPGKLDHIFAGGKF